MNSRTSLFQVEGSDVGHNLLLIIFGIFMSKNVILGLGDLFPYY